MDVYFHLKKQNLEASRLINDFILDTLEAQRKKIVELENQLEELK